MSLCLLLWAGGCARLERFEFTRVCMGVRARIVLYSTDRERATEAASGAFARLGALDAMMSDYRPSSDLSRVNAAAGNGEWVRVPTELSDLLAASVALARETDGAFDPTVGPAVRTWRRMRDERRRAPEHELALVRASVDWRQLEVREGEARLLRPGMALDLGGIGKGYAAEEAVRTLRASGHPRAMVALAGDVFAGQPPPGEAGWRVEVADGSILNARECGISSSGGGVQFVELGGERFAHIVDPRTGLGARSGWAVSVRAERGAEADALATAVFLLGPERGRDVLAVRGAWAWFAPGDGVGTLGPEPR